MVSGKRRVATSIYAGAGESRAAVSASQIPQRNGFKLRRYILSAVTPPFLMSLVIAVLLLLLEQMLRLFNVILVEQGPVAVVWKMLLNLLPEYLGLAIPIGFLIGVILGFRRLSQSNALDAMYAAGYSLRRAMNPIFAMSFLLMAATIGVIGFIQPYTAYDFERLGFLLQHGAFGLKIKSGRFLQIDENTAIKIAHVDPSGSNYGGIFLERCQKGRDCIITTAASAQWVFSPSGDRLSALRLFNGRQVNLSDPAAPKGVLSFAAIDISIAPPRTPPFRRLGEISDETPLPALARSTFSGPATAGYFENRAQFHWILLQGLAFLAIPFLGAVSGITAKRRSGHVAMAGALLVLIGYIQLLKAGELRAASGDSPWLIMWPGFFLLFLGSLAAFYFAAEKPGGFNPGSLTEGGVRLWREAFEPWKRCGVNTQTQQIRRRSAVLPASPEARTTG